MSEINEFSDKIIKELLKCEKKIIATPSPKDKSNGKYKQTKCVLESVDGEHRFEVFICEHIELLEIFSIGLVYQPESAQGVILTRYNGDHGSHCNPASGEIIEGFHIHTLTKGAINEGLKGESHAVSTSKYNTIQQALLSFFEDLHVNNYQTYFPELMQQKLL